MTTMKTWQSFAANQGAATTTWNYDALRGWLDNKRYADSQGPNYTYSPAGRLKTRTWARGLTTTYTHSNAGDLSAVSYSDSTPALSYGYDRRGRQTTATQTGGTTASRSFGDAGNLRGESYSGGPLGGLSVTNGYDQYLRRTNVAVLNSQSAVLAATGFGYDLASRLQTVTDGTNSAAYTYLDYSPLVGQVEFASNGVPCMIATKLYDSLNRLTSIVSSTNSVAVASFGYTYNAANQRTAAALADGTYWAYTYDNLGQVVSGRKYWADGTVVAGQQFVYGFDDIGNRQTAAAGGDSWGTSLRYQYYSANSLNQYVQRTVPGYAAMLGTANSNATVTLRNADGSYATALRKGDYFRAELPINNSTGAVWLTLTNLAVLNDGSNPDIVTSTTGQAFLPRTPEVPGYDADGNLTNDGRWSYSWDAENRLINLTSLSTAPAGSKLKLDLLYDSQDRRIQKIVSTNNGSAYYPQSTNRFIYDGWNLVGILNSSFNLQTSFMWGLDLSGSLQGAGGVGGLLATRDITNGVHFAAYDGNGNICALVNAGNGTVSAQYEYGPFGEVLRATGPMAKVNPFRFSTKYQDDETDLMYYGYRYYNASSGRWVNRDPIAERGGLNHYGFVGNDPVRLVDSLGLEVLCYYDDHGVWTCRSPLQSCKKCKCKSVQVLPSNQMVVIGGHYPIIDDVGMSVPIKIVVEGDPSLCKCSHRDNGSVLAGYPKQYPVGVFDLNKENPWQCDDQHQDVPGVQNVRPTPTGVPWSGQTDTYHLVYNLTITAKCVDSDGVPMTGSGTVSGSYWFTVVYNANGTVTGPTTISPPSGQSP